MSRAYKELFDTINLPIPFTFLRVVDLGAQISKEYKRNNITDSERYLLFKMMRDKTNRTRATEKSQ